MHPRQSGFQVDQAYRTLSRCNRALIRARDERGLTGNICEILVDTGRYNLAWVAMTSPEQPGVEVYGRAASIKPAHQADRLINLAETISPARGYGLTCNTVDRNRAIIHPEVSGPAGWRQESGGHHLPAQLTAQLPAISLPLRQGHKPIGALNILADTPDAFSRREIRLLNELAGDISFGIAHLRARRRHEMVLREKLQLQSQLRQAQKLEAIGTLAGGIAHDFNNLLHAILGYSGLLLRVLPEDSEPHRFSRTIKEAGMSAADLIRQILAFSRSSEKELQPMQIQHLLKEALRLLRSTLPATIELEPKIDMKCGAVLADPTEIHRIVMNLGTNAYHAMRRQGGRLQVSLQEIDFAPGEEASMAEVSAGLEKMQPGRHLCLEFVDQGCGMNREVMNRIFDPYFTTKAKGEGTGLGLAMTLGIIQGFQGGITVWSAPGKGARFRIFLPLTQREDKRQPDPLDKEQCWAPTIGCRRVLFVDDVEYNVILGEHTLRLLGCEVIGTISSREAWEIFAAFPDKFDLVITDQTMPGLTGFELAGRLLARRPELPVILLTGHSDLVDAESARLAGIRHFLLKPIEPERIGRVIRDIFQANQTNKTGRQ